jgi:hypothetical protein
LSLATSDWLPEPQCWLAAFSVDAGRRTTVHLNESSFTEIERILAIYDVKANEIIRAAVAIGLQRHNRKELLAALGPEPEPERPWNSQRITLTARRLGSPDAQTTRLEDGRYALSYATHDTAKALRKQGLSVHIQRGFFVVTPKAVGE